MTFTYSKNDFLMNYFSERLLEDLSDSFKGFEQRTGYVEGENNHHLLNEDERYASRIFRLQSALRNTSEQLQHIRLYINRYPFRKHYLANGISQLEYIQYHIEALYHKVHTVHEIMLLMVNEVYGLGLIQMKCRWPNILKILPSTEPH
ncbi:Cthe_2314 family HEPN domain-containing protein [Pedobacter aquatilis]|uniref:Cthe_2314 family HEPN domain-containing protein n=1 Tax=Pedobacter aquatilis TaxID=351343 RepID=UPI0025B4C5F4|nr:Cthe_2314 family HEPN domain-containing protein [Pedobacter aquatilis]MDN3588039.1 Cthe_2314 family HEPN domain-containing protein [Pedobacter aquatilis]